MCGYWDLKVETLSETGARFLPFLLRSYHLRSFEGSIFQTNILSLLIDMCIDI